MNYLSPLSDYKGAMILPDTLGLYDYKKVRSHTERVVAEARTADAPPVTAIGLAATAEGEPVVEADGQPARRLVNVADWELVTQLAKFELTPAIDLDNPPMPVLTWAVPTVWAWINGHLELGK